MAAAGDGGTPQRLVVEAGGIPFECLCAGPPDGPLALCLHGFPDTAHTWRHLQPLLAAAGFRSVAPFMRGYAPSGLAPDGNYQTGALAVDANALHQALRGGPDAVIVGHDWGAMAAYPAVVLAPERWRRAVTAAVPPPSAVMSSFFAYEQLKRSWYTFFFQTPLAELALPAGDWAFIDRLWQDWSPGYDAAWDLARVKESIGTPERMAAAIGYYRALYDGSGHDPALAEAQAATGLPVPRPTLYLHGTQDGAFALAPEADPLASLADGSEYVVIEGAGHFLHLERPDECNAHILRFLTA